MLTYNNKDVQSTINQTPYEARKKENELKSKINVSAKAKGNALYPELKANNRVKID